MEALSAKIPYYNKEEQRTQLSILATSPKRYFTQNEENCNLFTLILSKICMNAFQNVLFFSHNETNQHWTPQTFSLIV